MSSTNSTGSSKSKSSSKSNESGADKIIAHFIPSQQSSSKSSLESTVDRLFGDVTKASAAKQVAVGGGAGWVTGYLAVKIGKSAAITLGATVFALQVAQHKGIITIDWTKVHHAVGGVRDNAMSLIGNMEEDVVSTLKRFYNDNFFLAAGFTGGLAAGILF